MIGTKPIKNVGVTATTTKMVLITLIIVARYERPDTTICSSSVYRSLENLFTILPIGVLREGPATKVSNRKHDKLWRQRRSSTHVSKKDMGASRTTSSSSSNMERDARNPALMNIMSLQKVARMALMLTNA